MHIQLKVHTCGCISRCCGCNHRTGGNQWCTQYKCQYVHQKKCQFHLTQWKLKPKVKHRPLIEEQQEEQAAVLEGLKKRWAAEEEEELLKAKHEQEVSTGFDHTDQSSHIGTSNDYSTEFTSHDLSQQPGSSNRANDPALLRLQQSLKAQYAKQFSNPTANDQQLASQTSLYPKNFADSYSANNCLENETYFNNPLSSNSQFQHQLNQGDQSRENKHRSKLSFNHKRRQVDETNNIYQRKGELTNFSGAGESGSDVNKMAYFPRDTQFLDCIPQHALQRERLPSAVDPNESAPMYDPEAAQRTCHVGARRPPSAADCYGVHLVAGYGAQRSGYGVHPPSCNSYQPSAGSKGEQGVEMMAFGDCPADQGEDYHDEACPYAKPLSDIMEPRHYLYGSTTWKGVDLPFKDSQYELLLPSSHGTFQLLPSANPFEYIGRKRRGPEDRFHGQEQPLPVSAKRPEVFGNEYGIEQTTNHLGYRPQRRHFKERPSFILFN